MLAVLFARRAFVLAEFVMGELTLLAKMFLDVADHAQYRWWNEGNRQ